MSQRLQLRDTIVLRDNRSLIGTVERTSQWNTEPFDDCLIIAHTHVATDILDQFIASGVPPAGYVFIQFAAQEAGSSLVAEQDVLLIDRMLELGDVVKQPNAKVTGTVIDIASSYVLDPKWEPKPTSGTQFAAKAVDKYLVTPTSSCDAQCTLLDARVQHPCPSRLIPNVKFEEIKRVQDFMEGDYIIQDDWLGVVDNTQLIVVLKLSNDSVVVVDNPQQLFIPIPDHGKPLVSVQEFDGISRPHYVSTMQGWPNIISPEDLECGQFIITSDRNIRTGRWLVGSYDPQVKPEGHVLMVRCTRLSVQWLMCNAFMPKTSSESELSSRSVPYDNVESFPNPPELRLNRSVVPYDPSKHTAFQHDRTRLAIANGEKNTQAIAAVNVSSSFNVGDHVRFLDMAGATDKYQGTLIHGVRHGKFNRIRHTDTMLYDINEFEVFLSTQRATIRWQDGTTSTHLSTDLCKVTLFEDNFMPADIVVARQGMKQRRHMEAQPGLRHAPVDFNEMTYFEKPHDLLPAKVGVIQNMHAGDKVAQVRWFANPRIRITNYGHALGPESRFGPISDDIEDVSLYEVMAFPGLVRKLRDIVIIPPSAISAQALSVLNAIDTQYVSELGAAVVASSAMAEDRTSRLIVDWMHHIAKANLDAKPRSILDHSKYKPHRITDWVGEICQLRTDGKAVVRISTPETGLDVMIEHDQVLALVDDHLSFSDFDWNGDPMDIDDESSDTSSEHDIAGQVLEEWVDYQDGHRIDGDIDDSNWVSDDDSGDDMFTPMDAAGSDVNPDNPTPAEIACATQDVSGDPQENYRPILAKHLPLEEPAPFLSLEREPPSDQFRVSEAPQTAPSFLKRIAKEHRILASSLPKHEIYVRTYDSRLDLLRCLILGPLDTPYEHAPFLVDLHLGSGFPKQPPTAHFHSWTSGMGRINPNLYEDGKICLSLLGTWPGKAESEGWTEKATILQLLVSLQGLVFVKEPFYNEAGFEGYAETNEYKNESLLYSEKAYVMGRNFIKHALSRPIGGLEDVLAWVYLSGVTNMSGAAAESSTAVLQQIIARCEALMKHSDKVKAQYSDHEDQADILVSGDGRSEDATKVFLRPLSRGAVVMLAKSLKQLQDIAVLEREQLATLSKPK